MGEVWLGLRGGCMILAVGGCWNGHSEGCMTLGVVYERYDYAAGEGGDIKMVEIEEWQRKFI